MSNSQEISVQELIKNPIYEIPEKFLVDLEPAIEDIISDQSSAVPTINMQKFLDDETKLLELENLHSTCKDWGIFQLVNHGLDFSLLEKLKYEIQEFYELSSEEKSKFKIRPGEFEGYGQTLIQNSGDHRKLDWVDRETLEAYISELQKLSMLLLRLIAEALIIDGKELEEMFEDGMQSVRMNYYPPCPEPDKVIGLTPHSDGSALTFLMQVNGVEGLQIKKDGVWMPIKFLPEALIVNLGDVVEVLTNGLYKSIEHRATVNSEKERISTKRNFIKQSRTDARSTRDASTRTISTETRIKVATKLKIIPMAPHRPCYCYPDCCRNWDKLPATESLPMMQEVINVFFSRTAPRASSNFCFRNDPDQFQFVPGRHSLMQQLPNDNLISSWSMTSPQPVESHSPQFSNRSSLLSFSVLLVCCLCRKAACDRVSPPPLILFFSSGNVPVNTRNQNVNFLILSTS
ncbi:hypothetical protein ACS0TY_022005 [Phlomoides rotata]